MRENEKKIYATLTGAQVHDLHDFLQFSCCCCWRTVPISASMRICILSSCLPFVVHSHGLGVRQWNIFFDCIYNAAVARLVQNVYFPKYSR